MTSNIFGMKPENFCFIRMVTCFSLVVWLRWFYHHVQSILYLCLERWKCFLYYCVVFLCLHMIGYIMAIWQCSFVFAHYSTSLASLCKCIWRYFIYKIIVRYILSRVCQRLSQFSQWSFMIYMGLCVFGSPISLMIIVRIRVLYLNIIILMSKFHTHSPVIC